MTRAEILAQATQVFGTVPDWLNDLPDPLLEHQWGLTTWFSSDTALSASEKALVAFGAAAAIQCHY